ncbi:hypothetical protein LCO01nite_14500 [Lapidilactobacillus concavus]|nr:hypothetical protein LCO01nite_14500 [Lapidilactobacillus concavus]
MIQFAKSVSKLRMMSKQGAMVFNKTTNQVKQCEQVNIQYKSHKAIIDISIYCVIVNL